MKMMFLTCFGDVFSHDGGHISGKLNFNLHLKFFYSICCKSGADWKIMFEKYLIWDMESMLDGPQALSNWMGRGAGL